MPHHLPSFMERGQELINYEQNCEDMFNEDYRTHNKLQIRFQIE